MHDPIACIVDDERGGMIGYLLIEFVQYTLVEQSLDLLLKKNERQVSVHARSYHLVQHRQFILQIDMRRCQVSHLDFHAANSGFQLLRLPVRGDIQMTTLQQTCLLQRRHRRRSCQLDIPTSGDGIEPSSVCSFLV